MLNMKKQPKGTACRWDSVAIGQSYTQSAEPSFKIEFHISDAFAYSIIVTDQPITNQFWQWCRWFELQLSVLYGLLHGYSKTRGCCGKEAISASAQKWETTTESSSLSCKTEFPELNMRKEQSPPIGVSHDSHNRS